VAFPTSSAIASAARRLVAARTLRTGVKACPSVGVPSPYAASHAEARSCPTRPSSKLPVDLLETFPTDSCGQGQSHGRDLEGRSERLCSRVNPVLQFDDYQPAPAVQRKEVNRRLVPYLSRIVPRPISHHFPTHQQQRLRAQWDTSVRPRLFQPDLQLPLRHGASLPVAAAAAQLGGDTAIRSTRGRSGRMSGWFCGCVGARPRTASTWLRPPATCHGSSPDGGDPVDFLRSLTMPRLGGHRAF
jgi:hypothetical protein